jgi:hypothetical protein
VPRKKAERWRSSWQALAPVVVASALLLGCSASAVNRGADFYIQGRYIDADQLFEHHEVNLADYGAGERARYALYRGATYLALGDSANARRWLSSRELSIRASLSSAEQRLLLHSLRALRLGQAALPRELAGASSGALTVSTGQ